MQSKAICLRNVEKVYGNKGQAHNHALRGVSLTFEPSGCYAIMGASGSGKSTLLNILGGLIPLSSGRYLWGERDMGSLSERQWAEARRMSIGFIQQDFGLLEDRNALENVMTSLLLDSRRKWRDIKEQGIKALQLVDMADMAKKQVTQLSGGERQRVAIARAIAKQPALLLCDEPTGQLDEVNSRQVMDCLIRLNKEKMTTLILVTHNTSVAKRFTNLIRLSDGKVISTA